MNVGPYDYVIPVDFKFGSGEINTKTETGEIIHGMLMLIGIKAPNAAASYDLAIYDSADYLLYAETGLSGDLTSISLEKLCNSPLRIVILNATYDGNYPIRLYVRN